MTDIGSDLLWAARQNIYLLIRGYSRDGLIKREFHRCQPESCIYREKKKG